MRENEITFSVTFLLACNRLQLYPYGSVALRYGLKHELLSM